MSYSLDFRKQVFNKIKSQEHLSDVAVSRRYGISVRTLLRCKKQLEPKLTRNKPAECLLVRKQYRCGRILFLGKSTITPLAARESCCRDGQCHI
jgi:hypothetical protein